MGDRNWKYYEDPEVALVLFLAAVFFTVKWWMGMPDTTSGGDETISEIAWVMKDLCIASLLWCESTSTIYDKWGVL